eukprot:5857428-Pyramimonas_sp.AAC.1
MSDLTLEPSTPSKDLRFLLKPSSTSKENATLCGLKKRRALWELDAAHKNTRAFGGRAQLLTTCYSLRHPSGHIDP